MEGCGTGSNNGFAQTIGTAHDRFMGRRRCGIFGVLLGDGNDRLMTPGGSSACTRGCSGRNISLQNPRRSSNSLRVKRGDAEYQHNDTRK